MAKVIKGKIGLTSDFKEAFELLCSDLGLNPKTEKNRCKAQKGHHHGSFNYFCSYHKLTVLFDYDKGDFKVWYPVGYKEKPDPVKEEVKDDDLDDGLLHGRYLFD